MANCGRITEDILNDCNNILVGGVTSRLILFNKDDIDESEYVYNVSDNNIIEGIGLVSSSPLSRGYIFEGYPSSIEETRSAVVGAYRTLWNHQIVFRVFDNTPTAKRQIENIADGLFVAILENNYKGQNGNAAFELYGKVQGLKLTVAEAIKNDADSQGAYTITLSTPENYKEPRLPNTVFITDYNTTKSLVESLI